MNLILHTRSSASADNLDSCWLLSGNAAMLCAIFTAPSSAFPQWAIAHDYVSIKS
ncbi:MAG: hypothetical protein VKL59_24930 [Nostocaceae cyanobacterium]|nr:hypothetical protein [Nostocaceae cyanobacterium]